MLCTSWAGEAPAPWLRGVPKVMVSRVTLDATAPARRRVGALTYLGGIGLRSSDRAFGGFSAMLVAGDRFLLLSDIGATFAFRLGGDWIPRAMRFGRLPAGPGSGWLRKHRDSESLVRDPASGQLWVGFENANAVWRYAPGFAGAQAQAEPAAMREWSANGGAEAMVRLHDGRFLIFAESERVRDMPGTRVALLFDRDPTDPRARAAMLTYRPPYGYSPTDAVELPDGRLLVLNRNATMRDGFTARLAIIDRVDLRPGATLAGREIARFQSPVIQENFEALAVVREGREVILWIASDDNAPSWFQQTLLLKFRLELKKAVGPPSEPTAGR